jgi:Acetyltransferase (GNAT) domain
MSGVVSHMPMVSTIEVSTRGKWTRKPARTIGAYTVVANGRFVRTAAVHDEFWLAREVEDPASLIAELKGLAGKHLKADLFSFSQRLPGTAPKYPYFMEWDNVAGIRVSERDQWWNGLPQETRKNVRRAVKRGLEVRVVEFNDDLLRGIMALNNESPMRQGRPYAHYGKDLEAVRKDYASFLDRAKFIGAFVGDDLVGLAQVIYMGDTATLLELLTMGSHYDKRPANALITKAVDVCAEDGISFLTYGKFTYGNKGADNSLTKFKRHNGFEEFRLPRYYVPLTLVGRIVLACRLHRGALGILPQRAIESLLNLRGMWYKLRFARRPV